MLEKWVQAFIRVSRHNLTFVRIILASFPFLIIATNTEVAGESVLLAAAHWNYMMPLALVLIALYPFIRKLNGLRVPSWVWFGSLFLIVISLQMHEMLMVSVVGGFIGFVLYNPYLLKEKWFLSAVSAVVIGALLKLSSPGLWARSGKRGVGGYSTGLTDTEKLILKVASVFSDYPVLYPLISIGLIASVVSVSYVSKSLSIFTAGCVGLFSFPQVQSPDNMDVNCLATSPSNENPFSSARRNPSSNFTSGISSINSFSIHLRSSPTYSDNLHVSPNK